MPVTSEHMGQAEHNNRFWGSLDMQQTHFLDWVVVGMFYEAVHWIEAYLAIQEHHSSRLLKNSRRNCPEKGVTEIK